MRDAIAFCPIAPQDISPERLVKRGLTMSEDCLTLNIWTPAADGEPRPVLVFLHGGYWRALSSKDSSFAAVGPHALGVRNVGGREGALEHAEI